MLCVKCGVDTAVHDEDMCYRCLQQHIRNLGLEPHGYGDDGYDSDGLWTADQLRRIGYPKSAAEMAEDGVWDGILDDDPAPDERLGSALEDLFVLVMHQEREAEMLDRIDLAVKLGR